MIHLAGHMPPNFLHAWITFKVDQPPLNTFDEYMSALLAFANNYYLNHVIH